MFDPVWAPLYITVCPFFISFCLDIGIEYVTGVKQDLVSSLAKTLVWAFLSEVFHVVVMNARVYAYFQALSKWMYYRAEFWLRVVGWPIDAANWNHYMWWTLGWQREMTRNAWVNMEGDHPAIKVLVFAVKLVQIHVESYLFETVTNWSGNLLLPPIGLKPEYLPLALKGQPIYNGSASLWLCQIVGRTATELLLSVCLLAACCVYSVALYSRDYHPLRGAPAELGDFNYRDITNRRLDGASGLCKIMSLSILFRVVYQITYPMYLIIQPMCGILRLLPYVSVRSPLDANLFPMWQLVWSGLLMLLPAIVVAPVVNRSICILWKQCFTLVYRVMSYIDADYWVWAEYGYEATVGLGESILLTFDWNNIFRQIVLRNNTPVPRLDNHEGVSAAFVTNNHIDQHVWYDQMLEGHGFTW